MEAQIIIGTDKDLIAKSLEVCLVESGYRILAHCNNGQDILRRLSTHNIDLVILEPSLKGVVLKEIVSVILKNYRIPVIVLANDAESGYFYDLTGEFGFACIQKPLSKQALLQSIVLLINSMQAIKKLQAKVNTLEKKLENKDIILKAKEYLMTIEQMSENEAHRYIQKESMDRKITKEQMAKEILRRNN
ncbi:MAG: ANTAR domain-containing response regulator [Cellulosilyticaceae bacterium]